MKIKKNMKKIKGYWPEKWKDVKDNEYNRPFTLKVESPENIKHTKGLSPVKLKDLIKDKFIGPMHFKRQTDEIHDYSWTIVRYRMRKVESRGEKLCPVQESKHTEKDISLFTHEYVYNEKLIRWS